MIGVHVNWTAPFAARQPGSPYRMSAFEALTSALGALAWRRQGQPIHLYTDTLGLRFAREVGIAELYDAVDVDRLDAFTARCDVDLARAPCIGRMHVLGTLTQPFAAMDLDFVLFDAGAFPYADSDVCCYHWELPIPPWYPTPEDQFLPTGFSLPVGSDFTTLVPNIAFLYVANPFWFRDYAASAIDYITRALRQGCPLPWNKLAIFADQRLLGLHAAARGLRFETLLNDMWTCGPHLDHWEVLTRGGDLGPSRDPRELTAPFWILDRRRFDPRKESVESFHWWFEKPHGPWTSRQRAMLDALARRFTVEASRAGVPCRLQRWLARSGALGEAKAAQ